MADFKKAVLTVLRHEGGLADHPSDPGGITNFGVSIRFVTKIMPTQKVSLPFPAPTTPELIRALTKEQAMEIYRICWWDYFGYGQIVDQQVATKVFDMAVNMGPPDTKSPKTGRAHLLVQQAIKSLGDEAIVVDGLLGPKTYAAIDAIAPGKLLTAICEQQKRFYADLATAKPQYVVFLDGWLRRARWPF